MTNTTEEKIKEILEQEIMPALAMDGGACEFVSYKDGVLQLRLQGACAGCMGAAMTLKFGIENRLKQDIPELKEVIAV